MAKLQNGMAARIRAQLAEWRLIGGRSEREARAIEAARQLDADEVGRRADRRRLEREGRAAAGRSPTSEQDRA